MSIAQLAVYHYESCVRKRRWRNIARTTQWTWGDIRGEVSDSAVVHQKAADSMQPTLDVTRHQEHASKHELAHGQKQKLTDEAPRVRRARLSI